MPRGQKKKIDPNKIDVSEIAIADSAREVAEQRLAAVTTCPYNPELFEALLAQLPNAKQPLIDARDAALSRTQDTINSRVNPVINLYHAIEKALKTRLEQKA
jgi:hypothetical protein